MHRSRFSYALPDLPLRKFEDQPVTIGYISLLYACLRLERGRKLRLLAESPDKDGRTSFAGEYILLIQLNIFGRET